MDWLRNSWGFLSWEAGEGSYFHGFYLQESHQVLQKKICEDPLESLVGGQEKNPGEVRPEAYPVCVRVCVLVAQLCPTLCDPMDCSPSDSSVLGILQARILEWVVISFFNGKLAIYL